MIISKLVSSAIENGVRTLKAIVLGKDDVRTALEVTPFGVDSNPTEGLMAIYVETSAKGDRIIVGYLNTNQLAEVGGTRIFSTDKDGNAATSIYLRADGTIEVRGTGDNMVRYIPLDSGLQSFKSQIQAELALIAAGIAAAGGSYTPGTLSVDISGAKIDEIKTP